MVITNKTGTTMRLRQLWLDWNPKRLRRLLVFKNAQIDANANLAANYYQQLLQARKEIDILLGDQYDPR